jgi:uncharacterized cupin superfamily protein
MRRVAVDDVAPEPYDEDLHADRRPLSAALGTDHVAVVRYALDPGERFSGALHAHADQEEVFVVLEGTATFTTEDGEVTVGDGEAVRFTPGEFQSGGNETDDRLVALALGTPADSEDVRIARILTMGRDVSCPECGHDHLRVVEVPVLVCPACDATVEIP